MGCLHLWNKLVVISCPNAQIKSNSGINLKLPGIRPDWATIHRVFVPRTLSVDCVPETLFPLELPLEESNHLIESNQLYVHICSQSLDPKKWQKILFDPFFNEARNDFRFKNRKGGTSSQRGRVCTTWASCNRPVTVTSSIKTPMPSSFPYVFKTAKGEKIYWKILDGCL